MGDIIDIKLQHGDCLELMKVIEDKSIDLILCDLPYGITARNKWDTVIPFEPLWEQYSRVIKDNGAIVLFGSGMFTSDLMQSNKKMWKYNIIWDKVLSTGFLNAKKQPLRSHEDICIFYKKPPTYNPQKIKGAKSHSVGKAGGKNKDDISDKNTNYGAHKYVETTSDMKYPKSIVTFQKTHPSKTVHPTQKPVELLEWLVKTYSNENETVLDNCMGSGSTGVVCKGINRKFIGIELDDQYFEIAQSRMAV